jgi:SPP1 gp7 family putative phage head morphogenesis protein
MVQATQFLRALEARRARSGARVPNKVPKPPSRRAEELSYMDDLDKVHEVIEESVDLFIFDRLNIFKNSFNAERQSFRVDDLAQDIERSMFEAEDFFKREMSDLKIINYAEKQARKVNAKSQKYISDTYSKISEISFSGFERWLPGDLEAFQKENLRYIKNISSETYKNVETSLYRSFRQGLNLLDIQEELSKSVNFSKQRLRLVARDQTQKLYSHLTKMRHLDAGLNKYEWSSSLDERTRDSHREKHGKIFDYNDPPSDTGNPGDGVNCRCDALAVIPDF